MLNSEPLTIHLQQASMQFTDPQPEQRHDLMMILGRHADVVGFTEVARMGGPLQRACELHGYELRSHGAGALAVRADHRVLDSGATFVNPAKRGPASEGGHGARYIVWVKVKIGTEVVYVNEAHWVTGMGQSATRRAMHADMSEAVVRHCQEQGAGRRLAFWMGDTNADDGADVPIYDDLIDPRLTSCWDELGIHPSTSGPRKTIDVIGSYDPDRRVTANHARRWPQVFSDHRQVSAWYSITPARAS